MDRRKRDLIDRALPDRVDSVLRSTAMMLDAQIELRRPGARLRFGREQLSCCDLCARADQEGHRNCTLRRDGGSLSPSDPPPLQQWICPHGCEVATMPFALPGGSPATLSLVRTGPVDPNPGAARTQETMAFLRNLTGLISEQLNLSDEIASLTDELGHRRTELTLLHSISHGLSDQQDLRQVLRSVLRQARGAIGADVAVVMVDRPSLLVQSCSPQLDETFREDVKQLRHLGALLTQRLTEQNRNYYSGSLRDLGSDLSSIDRAAHLLGVSLQRAESIGGVLFLIHIGPTPRTYHSEIRLVDAVAARCGALLMDNDHRESLKDFLMSTVKTLVSAIDAKDPYTSGHSERVNLLSMLLGKTMGLNAADLEILRWASILHDIGKIGMPETILTKPGALTPEEYEIVKEHPERGYRVISPIRQLSTASLGVRCHHERIDGGGYPLGLRGEEIPLPARIIAVADTYDALTSNRSYRSQRTPDRAFEVIRGVCGTQLDPDVVDVLETLLPFIREHQVMLQPSRADAVHTPLGDPKIESS